MKKSDEILLKQLKPFGLRFVGEAEWALLEKAVDEAGSVTAVDATARYIIEKASFASRSEAARYAANMRWRGSNPKGLKGAQEEARAKAGAPAGGPKGTKASAGSGKGKEDKAAKKQRVSEIRATLKDKDISDLAGAIRREFRAQGKQIPPALKPYLDAMGSLSSVKDRYYEDTGASVVAYALSNMGTFKGDVAAAIKEELKARLKGQSFIPEKGSGPKQSMEAASSRAKQSKGKTTGRSKDKTSKKQRIADTRAKIKDKPIKDIVRLLEREWKAEKGEPSQALQWNFEDSRKITDDGKGGGSTRRGTQLDTYTGVVSTKKVLARMIAMSSAVETDKANAYREELRARLARLK